MQSEADLIGGVNLDVKDRKLYFSDDLKFRFVGGICGWILVIRRRLSG